MGGGDVSHKGTREAGPRPFVLDGPLLNEKGEMVTLTTPPFQPINKPTPINSPTKTLQHNPNSTTTKLDPTIFLKWGLK